MTEHKRLKKWVEECAKMCQPDKIVWLNGSEEERATLEQQACDTGEVIRLNQELMPGCLYHRTAPNDVARTEDLTFICTGKKEEAGPNNNWMLPKEGYKKAREIFAGAMRGRTMYVIPFSMGPVGSPFSKIGVELTDSIYVALNMRIMTRIGAKVLEQLGKDGEFTKGLHSKAQLDITKRLILHFPQDNTIWSVGSGYGGNVLLGKKCLSLRIASYLARKENWLAEHMLIMGIEEPNGRIDYIAAAFPSACGKTNLAMLIPPEGLKVKGYKVWTVGDDIAWMRVDTDGALWAVNPESGFFGVAPGTNSKTNPNMMEAIKKNTIFTNVLLKIDGTVWWEEGDGPVPAEGINWLGRPWKPGLKDEKGNIIKAAHANSRFTVPASQCPSISYRLEHHHGVLLAAIVFGGRRARLAPLVYESFSWQHGVYVGATMASERTAAQFGKQGEVRRDPMALFPFCGYNMADYFSHWLNLGKKIEKKPRIFNVNWFRVDEEGEFMWPGYGENLRVLEWILSRCRGEVEAHQTPIGYVPWPQDIDLTGLKLNEQNMEKLVAVDKNEWLEELQGHQQFFAQFGDRMPQAIWDEYEALKQRLESK
ncbi:MAG: phosphoenolpyruvate carboxykinase (GTP) [Elusimicrobia bacterium]|nr:phosphoenolpyruvate carboxykinase (GTP) [Elusimicrobiota bacterium]